MMYALMEEHNKINKVMKYSFFSETTTTTTKINLNLIKPLSPSIYLLEIERTEEHIK